VLSVWSKPLSTVADVGGREILVREQFRCSRAS
jgi:hypothetical protein